LLLFISFENIHTTSTHKYINQTQTKVLNNLGNSYKVAPQHLTFAGSNQKGHHGPYLPSI
jgi:hypothetical protein